MRRPNIAKCTNSQLALIFIFLLGVVWIWLTLGGGAVVWPRAPLSRFLWEAPSNYSFSPESGSIFFIESSCVFNNTKQPPGGRQGGVVLNPRQTCAVYSAAFVHPYKMVYLYHSCPLEADYYSRSSDAVKSLLRLKNVKVVQLDKQPEVWFRETPIEGFAAQLSESVYPVEHSSDALRMLLLWKYGGIYLDLDIVVLRDLSELGENWAGAEDKRVINNGIMSFGAGDPGHLLVNTFLRQIPQRYDPKLWSGIGPLLLSDVIAKECGIKPEEDFKTIGKMKCGFEIFKTEVFFPLHYSQFQSLFNGTSWEKVKDAFSKAYTAHAWNKLSSSSKIEPGSAYARFASAVCPPVYNVTDGLQS